MIEDYLNQTCTLLSATGQDDFGQSIVTEKTIKCKWENKLRMVRNAAGEIVASNSKVFTAERINIADKLKKDNVAYPVISVAEINDLDGEVSHYEVYC